MKAEACWKLQRVSTWGFFYWNWVMTLLWIVFKENTTGIGLYKWNKLCLA